MKNIAAVFFMVLFIASCKEREKDYQTILSNPYLYSKTVHDLTKVITHDIFTPPVAARIYAYANLAAYEVVAATGKEYQSLEAQIKGLIDIPDAPKEKINHHFASLIAYMNVGQELTFSKDSTEQIIEAIKTLAIQHGMPEEEMQHSIAYAGEVSKAVLLWGKGDNYAQTRSAARYTVNNDEGKWIPTPPGYMQAAEPAWMEIRPIVMDWLPCLCPSHPQLLARTAPVTFTNWQMRYIKRIRT